jgi:hypothetical protein
VREVRDERYERDERDERDERGLCYTAPITFDGLEKICEIYITLG